jgi:hypothetical protein
VFSLLRKKHAPIDDAKPTAAMRVNTAFTALLLFLNYNHVSVWIGSIILTASTLTLLDIQDRNKNVMLNTKFIVAIPTKTRHGKSVTEAAPVAFWPCFSNMMTAVRIKANDAIITMIARPRI